MSSLRERLPGERPVKRGKVAVGAHSAADLAQGTSKLREARLTGPRIGNDDREGEEFFGQHKQSAKSAKNQVNRVKHFTNFHKTSMAGLLSLKKWTPE